MFDEVYKIDTMTKDINDITFTDYYYRLTLLARSVFKWEGLPNGISEKWIEKYLYNNGSCVFYKDKTLGYAVAKASQVGTLNPYDEPTQIQPVMTNYPGGEIPILDNFENCVLIWNNDLKLPTYPSIRLYAYRLAEITRTSDVNVNAQKTPVLITGSNRNMTSLKNVYRQWKGNEPVIFGDKQMDNTPISVLKTDAPIVFDKLRLEKHEIWNECMTFLGINNANQNKKERVVADEVSANNEQMELSAYVMLKTRQEACDMINKMFGLNVSVRFRELKEIELQKGCDTVEGAEEVEECTQDTQ